jgi:thiamine biosynthesis lipoprotein
MRPEEPRGTGLALGEATSGIDAHTFAHEAMATCFEVICAHDDGGYAAQAAQAAFDLVDRLERELSRFIANSDVSRINALAAGRATRVSPTTIECLEIARDMSSLTGGAFDISIGSGLEHLELDPDRFAVRARAGGMRLDLGGIGKGYAVDRMAEVLDEWEVHRALLHGGFSSVLAREAPRGRDGWPLSLTAPGGAGARIRLSARHLALSASGTQKGAHIQDPRTGRPVADRAAWAALPTPPQSGATESGEWAAVLRSPAAVAEALSTAFMILPSEEVAELCRRGPGLQAWLSRPAPGEGQPDPGLVHLGTGSAGRGAVS